jgi:hypothetical protein
MTNEHYEDPIPQSVQEFLTVFKTDLSAVVFPDVSFDGLETLAQKVRSGAKELQDALSHAESVRESLESGKNELLTKSMRGLAYAKVFAEGNDELLEKLSGINLGKAGRSPKKTASEKKPKTEDSTVESGEGDAQKPEEKKPAKASKKSAEQG